MDYATAVEVFFQPGPAGTPEPEPVQTGGPARRLRDAIEPLGSQGFWSPLANTR